MQINKFHQTRCCFLYYTHRVYSTRARKKNRLLVFHFAESVFCWQKNFANLFIEHMAFIQDVWHPDRYTTAIQLIEEHANSGDELMQWISSS